MNEMIKATPLMGDYLTAPHKNELQLITSLIQNTQKQHSRLKLELDERMEKLNNAQLRALQSQIDPHFIYNTLDTVNWMAIDRLGMSNEVSEMVSALANLLRSSLTRSAYLVTVADELEQARMYVKILETRYKDKLTVNWDIDEDVLSCRIIKLCLQPLIENAIKHGLHPKRFIGTVTVTGRRLDKSVVLSVIDDGVGISEEECARLNSHLKTDYQEDEGHLGIRNVNQRIKILFGDKFGVVLTPVDAGACATVVIPYQTA
jgi:two-component system sensor histidine kinase YesM